MKCTYIPSEYGLGGAVAWLFFDLWLMLAEREKKVVISPKYVLRPSSV